MIHLVKCVFQTKTEDVNLSVFNMITRKNEPKTLAKDTSCECKCKFDGRKCNSNQNWNKDKCQCEFKNPRKTDKNVILRILLHVVVKTVNIWEVLLSNQ